MTMPRLLILLLLLVAGAACTPRTAPSATPSEADDSSTAVPELEETNTPIPSEIPAVTATQPPSPTPVCPGAPRTRLIVEERGRVLPDDPRPVNLRDEPDGPIITGIPVGELFYVLEGPVCTQDGERAFAWYRVRYGEYDGWIAEGDMTSYYVEPIITG